MGAEGYVVIRIKTHDFMLSLRVSLSIRELQGAQGIEPELDEAVEDSISRGANMFMGL